MVKLESLAKSWLAQAMSKCQWLLQLAKSLYHFELPFVGTV
jgi:hypothetical protein